MKRLLIGLLLLSLMFAGNTLAAKPLSPTLVATPNPALAGQAVTITGSNYPIGQVCLNIAGAMTCGYSDDGTIQNEWPYFTQPGEYEVFSYWKKGRTVIGPKITVIVN